MSPTAADNLQPSLRKAAILIDSLDAAAADALLDQVDPQYAARVRQAVMELHGVRPEEREAVIQEFLRGQRPAPAADDTGIELDGSLAARLASAASAAVTPAEPAAADGSTPFRFLHEAPGDTLAAFLRHEHPQTVAVVVSHLPPQRAADVLTHLPDQLQVDVLRRVAQLDETDPEIIAEIERQLQLLLADELRTLQRRSAGLAALRAILAAADIDQRERLLANLNHTDHQLAEQLLAAPPAAPIHRASSAAPPVPDPQPAAATATPPVRQSPGADRPAAGAASPREPAGAAPTREPRRQPALPPLEFEDLARLDDHSLALVVQQAPPAVTLVALTGAPDQLVDRLVAQLPAREGRRLRHKLQHVGPLRLRDVDRAQAHLARLAAQLVAEGKVPLPAPLKRFATAA